MVMPIRVQVESHLTGETRVRKQFFTGKLILQVEVSLDSVQGFSREYNVATRWRDAMPADVGLDFASVNLKPKTPPKTNDEYEEKLLS